jgi:hypothetical protein
MEKSSSTKYYVIGALIIIAVIAGVFFFSRGGSESDQAPAQASSIIGTWRSTEAGKGMQATGTLVTARASTELTMAGDVQVVIQKVENNVAEGTMTYSNLCTTAVITMTGKSPITEKPQCITITPKPIQVKVAGNAITFDGPSDTGGTVTFTGTFSNDAFSGSFTRAGSVGTLSGTFHLVRSQ